MFHRLREYPLIDIGGRWYRPRAYGDDQPDGTWDGWVVFFPASGGEGIPSERPATRSTFNAVEAWASRLTPSYLESALASALLHGAEPSSTTPLSAEYELSKDPSRFHTGPALEPDVAHFDEAAAAEARAAAEQLRLEQLAAETALVATDFAAASEAADEYQEAPSQARAGVVGVERRSPDSRAEPTVTHAKRRSKKKKK